MPHANIIRAAVIGAGPAGLMAGIVALENGAGVTLFDRNEKAGKKLYITGKGRCNVCNACAPADVLKNIVNNAKFLTGAIHRFSPDDVIEFFENAGLSLKIERGGRVFPMSDKASDVTKALQKTFEKSGGKMQLNAAVRQVSKKDGMFVLSFEDGHNEMYDRVIIATGGKSYPSTGSIGDGYRFAEAFGHAVIPPRPALVPFVFETAPDGLAGLSLKNVDLWVDGETLQKHEFGEALFTHKGISGPAALSLSSRMLSTDLMGRVLYVDLKPALSTEQLDARLIREFAGAQGKQLSTVLTTLMPKNLISYVLRSSQLSGDTKASEVTKNSRKMLCNAIKALGFPLKCLAGFEEAIITSGGVSVAEVDPKSMQSRLVSGLFFAGEVLDVDALTGGFNIQIALSTGFVAGMGVVN